MSGNPLLNALSAIRTPPVMGMSVGYDTLANALSGVPANLAGAPVDMAYMMTMRPEEMAGIAMGMPNQRPELREFPGSSDWIGEKMGADVDSLPFLLSALISPDGSDVALPAAKLAASGKLDDLIQAMTVFHGSPLKRNGEEIAPQGMLGGGVSLREVAKMSPTGKEWADLSVDDLDRVAFGFAPSDIDTLPTDVLGIKWQDDLDNVIDEIAKSGKSETEWARSVNISDPIDVVYEGGGFKIDDGHHRYMAAKILGEDLPVRVSIIDKPHAAIVERALAEGLDVNPQMLDAAGIKRNGEEIAQSLPMDEASRMARAQEMGFTTDVYHGTLADIDEFDPDLVDIGVHVGSKDQAENRLLDLYKQRRFDSSASRATSSFDEGANIMPLKAKMTKTLEMPDVGRWDNSEQVLAALNDIPEFNEHPRLNEAWDELGFPDQFESTDDWVKSPENREMLDEINSVLREHGYDSVKYENAVENRYGGLTELTQSAKALKEELNAEIKAINSAVNSRRPEIPENATPEDIQRFLDWDFDSALTSEEAQRLDSIKSRLMNDPAANEYEDPYSYILLDTKNIRSKNATFDPKKSDSANLNAMLTDALMAQAASMA